MKRRDPEMMKRFFGLMDALVEETIRAAANGMERPDSDRIQAARDELQKLFVAVLDERDLLEAENARAKYDRDVERTVNRQLVELCRKLVDGNDNAEKQLAGIIGMDGRWD